MGERVGVVSVFFAITLLERFLCASVFTIVDICCCNNAYLSTHSDDSSPQFPILICFAPDRERGLQERLCSVVSGFRESMPRKNTKSTTQGSRRLLVSVRQPVKAADRCITVRAVQTTGSYGSVITPGYPAK